MEQVVIEISEPMVQILDAMVKTGLFGPNRDTAAQRLLEQKLFEVSLSMVHGKTGG